MPVTRAQKEEILSELNDLFQKSKSVFFSDYRGLSVGSLQKLRRALREKGVHYKIAKKTLIRKAASGIGYDSIPDNVVDGSLAVAVSMEDALAGAKLLQTFSKEFPQLKLLGGLFEKNILNAAQAKEYAMLPSKEELLAKLVYLLKSPLQGAHGALSNVLSGFVRVVDAYREKMEKNMPVAPVETVAIPSMSAESTPALEASSEAPVAEISAPVEASPEPPANS